MLEPKEGLIFHLENSRGGVVCMHLYKWSDYRPFVDPFNTFYKR